MGSCPAAFQASISNFLNENAEYAAIADLSLLSRIAHIQSLPSTSAAAIRECILTEARVHLVQKRFSPAIRLLNDLLSNKIDAEDAMFMESFCLLNHARESQLIWDSYEQHYARLARILSHLFRTDSPHASQCIAPFSALSTPLGPQQQLQIAASAARRELARLRMAGEVPRSWHAPFPSLALDAQGGLRRLRVGYMTSEFGDNSVGREMAAVAAAHSRARVVVLCFALSLPPQGSGRDDKAEQWRRRMSRLCC